MGEITKKADEAVQMFEGHYAECGGFISRMSKENAIECAILMYKRDVKMLIHLRHSTTDNSAIIDELNQSQSILENLKERVK